MIFRYVREVNGRKEKKSLRNVCFAMKSMISQSHVNRWKRLLNVRWLHVRIAWSLCARFALFNCLKVTCFSIIQVVKPVVARFHHSMVCAPYCTEMLVLFFLKMVWLLTHYPVTIRSYLESAINQCQENLTIFFHFL